MNIGSPLESTKSNISTLAMVSLDVQGNENPQFACIITESCRYDEANEEEWKQRILAWYEVENRAVIQKGFTSVDRTAHMLIQVPSDIGPGGVIVVCEKFLVYKRQGHEDRVCYIPQRRGHDISQGL